VGEKVALSVVPAGCLTSLRIRGRGGSDDVVLRERTETLTEVIAGLGPAGTDGGDQ